LCSRPSRATSPTSRCFSAPANSAAARDFRLYRRHGFVDAGHSLDDSDERLMRR
jgi:hypothetical protein